MRARSNNKEAFPLPLDEVWEIFIDLLGMVSEKYHAHIHSFVLMRNHYHLILSTPQLNLDAIMQYLNREASKQIGLKSGRINRIFGGRYQRSLIEEDSYFLNAYKYVFRNPVKAGVCGYVEDYRFSTLPIQLGKEKWPFPLSFEPEFFFELLPVEKQQLLNWLNVPYSAEQNALIRKGLRRKVFRWNAETSRPLLESLLSPLP